MTPDIATEIQHLETLREQHKKLSVATGNMRYPPLSVFGHADPVGPAVDPDGYNKALSGRRATAIYALLIINSNPDTAARLWKQIAAVERWGADQQRTMQANVPAGTSDSGLYKAYMQKLCPASLKLTPQDFLAQGADHKGKGDYQGCSSFNPLLIFSQNEETQYEQAEQNKDEPGVKARNAANAPNRRVIVLLFRPGSQVLPTKWPCPSAMDDKSGCIKRFWSDGDKRRHNRLQDAERKFEDTHDTFACRFYQRISDSSPCEGPRKTLVIWLLDDNGQRVAAGTPYRLNVAGQVREGKLQTPGLIVEPDIAMARTADLEWAVIQAQTGRNDSLDQYLRQFVMKTLPDHPFVTGTTPIQAPAGLLLYRAHINLTSNNADVNSSEVVTIRLRNMGYPLGLPIVNNLTIFQDDYEVDDNAQAQLQLKLRDVHRDGTEMPLKQDPIPDPVPIPLDNDGIPIKQCDSQ
ncbi:MAG TPA: hypothetical protein VLY24_17925 [Bryobacteraceae bacterium]|nr:hypothetical protein [Bryobacteraceae bacterium]